MAVIDKLNNTNALNLATSWSGSIFPGTADLARWNFNAANAVSTGLIASGTNGLSVGAIQWTSVQQNLTTISSGTAGPITLNGYISGSNIYGVINNGYVERFDCQVNIPTAQTWSIGNGPNTLVDIGYTSANGFLSGSGDIIKTGPTGSLRFFRANPLYTGNIYIDEGDVMISAVGATAGSGIIYLNRNNNASANPQIGSSLTVSPTIANTIIANGNFSLQANSTGNSSGTGTVTYSGPIQILTTSSINLGVPAGAATITGQISSSGNVNIAKTGAGNLNLNNSNPNFKGTIRMVAATINVGNIGALQNIILDSRIGDTGTWAGTSNYTIGGLSGDRGANITISPINIGNSIGLDANFSGVISNSAVTTKIGTNTQVWSGNNTRTGLLTVSDGILTLAHANAAGNTATAITSSGGTLELSGGIALFSKPLSISGTGYNNSGSLRSISGSNTYSGSIRLVADSSISVEDGVLFLLSALTGSASLTKIGAGTLELDAESVFSGQTTVSLGTLRLSAITPVSGTLVCDSIGSRNVIFGNTTRVDIPKYDGGANGIKILNLENTSNAAVAFHTYADPDTYVPTFTGTGTYYKHGSADIDLRNKTTTNISVEGGRMLADDTTILTTGVSAVDVAIKAALQTPGATHMSFPRDLTFSNNATMTFGN